MKKLWCILISLVVFFLLSISSLAKEDIHMTREEGLMLVLEGMRYDKIAEEKNYECSFDDVEDDFRVYAGYAYEKKWIKGIGDNKFAPDEEMTRECFITIVLRLLGYDGTFLWNDPYERAEICGIYPTEYTGDFTREEAKVILAKMFFAYTYQSGNQLYKSFEPGREIADLVEKEKEERTPYTDAVSKAANQLGVITFRYEDERLGIFFGRLTGTPHGSNPLGYVICKADGATRRLSFPWKNPFNQAEPENVYLDEEKNMLYYTCRVDNDVISMADNTTVLQEAGVFEYSVNLTTRETVIKKIENN